MRLTLMAGLAALVLFAAPRAAEAGTAVRMDVPALVDGSGIVLEARVLSARAVQAGNGLICTEYVLSVDRTFWGAPQALRTVRLPGGALPDGRGLAVPGVPRLAPGEDTILFLSPEGQGGFSMPVGLSQGRFRVVTDPATGARTLVRSQAGLELLDPATGAVQKAPERAVWDYAETVARIHAACAARTAREAAGTPGEGRR
jgi:hypothetical protein